MLVLTQQTASQLRPFFEILFSGLTLVVLITVAIYFACRIVSEIKDWAYMDAYLLFPERKKHLRGDDER